LRTLALLRALAIVAGATSASTAAEHPLTLDEAITRSLQKNGDVVVQREGVVTAIAGQLGAKSIYDPVVKATGEWLRQKQPVNSSFSGAPLGQDAATARNLGFSASLEQLLPTGGKVTVRADGTQSFSNGTFALLSPAYFPRVGIELRQPLDVLLPQSTSATRYKMRVATL